MLKRKIATATVVICLMGLARMATAQNSSDEFRPFNGFFADMFDDGSAAEAETGAAAEPTQPITTARRRRNCNARRRGPRNCKLPPQRPDAGLPIPPPPPSGVDNYHCTLAGRRPQRSGRRPRSSATGNNYSFQYDDATLPSGPALSPPSPSTLPGGDAATIVHGPRGACRLAAARATEGLPPLALRRHGPGHAALGGCPACRPACRFLRAGPPQRRRLPSAGCRAQRHRPVGPVAAAGRCATSRSGTAAPPAEAARTVAGACRAAASGDGQAGQRRRPRAERPDRSQESAVVGGNHRTAEDRGRQGGGL